MKWQTLMAEINCITIYFISPSGGHFPQRRTGMSSMKYPGYPIPSAANCGFNAFISHVVHITLVKIIQVFHIYISYMAYMWIFFIVSAVFLRIRTSLFPPPYQSAAEKQKEGQTSNFETIPITSFLNLLFLVIEHTDICPFMRFLIRVLRALRGLKL